MSLDDLIGCRGGNSDNGSNCHSAPSALSEGILVFVYRFDIQLITAKQETKRDVRLRLP
jgi:hypothetical protein